MPNLNTGTDWSQMDLDDLVSSLGHGDSVAKTADFLCRDEDEVQAKMTELGLKVRERGSSDDSRPS